MIDLNAKPVVIPDMRNEIFVSHAMGDIDAVPEVYNVAYRCSHNVGRSKEQRDAKTPEEIAAMFSHWFFSGLKLLKFNLKADAVACNEREFGEFARYVLGSFEPKHEHKMAFLTWVTHVCCDSVTYQVKE